MIDPSHAPYSEKVPRKKNVGEIDETDQIEGNADVNLGMKKHAPITSESKGCEKIVHYRRSFQI